MSEDNKNMENQQNEDKSKENQQNEDKSMKNLQKEDKMGLILVAAAIIALFAIPDHIAGIFGAMFESVKEIAIDVFINGQVGVAIIVSVMTGRVLERLGFTDALLRLFIPYAKIIGVNSSIVVPSVYNILGDINAAGRIAGPVLEKGNATLDEKKIAIATMVQSQQSFSTLMLGLLAFAAAGINSALVVIIAVFGPIVIVPLLLGKTIWRDTKALELAEMPRFTPKTGALPTIFGGAKEGAELLFLLIIPAVSVVFAIIGALDYIGIWAHFEEFLTVALNTLSIHPETGILSIMASPTLAMSEIVNVAAEIDPALLIGSFVLASSGFPLSVVFGQVPAIWADVCDISEREAMKAAVLGVVMRFITAAILAAILTPILT